MAKTIIVSSVPRCDIIDTIFISVQYFLQPPVQALYSPQSMHRFFTCKSRLGEIQFSEEV